MEKKQLKESRREYKQSCMRNCPREWLLTRMLRQRGQMLTSWRGKLELSGQEVRLVLFDQDLLTNLTFF